MTRKLIALALFGLAFLHAGVCPIQQSTGFNMSKQVSFNGFVPGAATSDLKRDLHAASKDAGSDNWMAHIASNVNMTTDINWQLTRQIEYYVGQQFHVFDSRTARRGVVRDNPVYSKISTSKGSMTSGSNIITLSGTSPFETVNGPFEMHAFTDRNISNGSGQYISDIGRNAQVTGACSGSSFPTCASGVLGGFGLPVAITGIIDATHATLSTPATVTVTNAKVTVGMRETYGGDPGTFPFPPNPRIQSFYDVFCPTGGSVAFCSQHQPHPLGLMGQDYLVGTDQHIIAVDSFTCLEYDYYGCFDDGANISCANYRAYNMMAGDHQMPYGRTGGFDVAGIPVMSFLLRAEEWTAGVINHALGMSASFAPSNTMVAFTGAATGGQCCGPWDTNFPPFGAPLHLKNAYSSVSWDPTNKCGPMITALKKYGARLTDGGSNGTIWAENVKEWNPGISALSTCQELMANNMVFDQTTFEIATLGPTYCVGVGTGCPNGNTPTGAGPTISSFTVTPASLTVAQITAGQKFILHWVVSGATDADGHDNGMRNISWGKDQTVVCSETLVGGTNPCKFGSGWILGPDNHEQIYYTPPAVAGTYHPHLLVQNGYATTGRDVSVTVAP